MVLKKIQLATFLLLFPIIIYAGDTPQSIFQIDPSSKITGDWFLAYNYNRSKNFNQYGLKRGYFTIKTKLNEILSTR
ncbi:MAG: hypothetical protein K9M80_06060, partial [Candidatus Marinimicrobia bacterium]|nr:hypothetical protein [Candidatus Neomarinimicrobiota bacterium]